MKKETDLVKDTGSNVLENGRIYGAVFNGAYVGFDYITDVTTFNMGYTVYINPWKTIEIVNSFRFYDYVGYESKTKNRLIREFSHKYNFQFSGKEFRNEHTIANACKPLIGTKVEIKPFNYKGFQRYRVIATERKQHLNTFDNLKSEYYNVFGNKKKWAEKQQEDSKLLEDFNKLKENIEFHFDDLIF